MLLGSPRPVSSFLPITAAFRTPPCAASESANAAAKKAASCAPASARLTKKNIPRAAALTSLGNDAREKSSATDGAVEEVKESLDLCLACKGCKSDCPVGVDVATYKAEFLSHYYEGRLRPLSAYAFGNIDFWARLASIAPGVVNLTTQLPFLRDIAKKVAGIPRQRSIPPFAPETFKQWFYRTGSCRGGRIRPPREAERAWGRVQSNDIPEQLWKSAASGPRQRARRYRGFSP